MVRRLLIRSCTPLLTLSTLLLLFTPLIALADLGTTITSSWTMDEASSATRVDSVSAFNFANNGTVNAGTGRINNGATNWSAANFLQASDQNALDLSSGDFTICAWVNSSTWTTGNSQAILAKDDSATKGWRFYLQNAGGAAVFQTNAANNYIFTNGESINTWYQLCVVVASAQITLYRNAAVDTGAQAFIAPTATTNVLLVGKSTDATPRVLPSAAVVDEVLLYTRALSAKEITTLYNNGGGCQYSFSVCQFQLWKMFEF